jgi:hypothetical protein
MCDWIDNALVFSIRSEDLIYGMLRMDAEVRNYIAGPDGKNLAAQ